MDDLDLITSVFKYNLDAVKSSWIMGNGGVHECLIGNQGGVGQEEGRRHPFSAKFLNQVPGQVTLIEVE